MALIARAASVDDILDAVGRNGLRSLPRFALVHADGDATVAIVRGAIEATLLTGDDEPLSTLTGVGARSWHEAPVSDEAATILLCIPALALDNPAVPMLPLYSGVVLAALARVQLADAVEVADGKKALAVETRRIPSAPASGLPGLAKSGVAAAPAPTVSTVDAPPTGDAESSPSLSTERDDSELVGLTASYSEAVSEETAATADAVPATENAGASYDHLFEATQGRTVEGAAMRPPAPAVDASPPAVAGPKTAPRTTPP